MKKIDIHCHVTAKNLSKDLIKLEKQSKVHDVRKIFLMSTYFPQKGNGVSNYRLYHHIKNKNLFKMYLSLDFGYFWMAYNEMTEILQNDRNKVAGIKIYTGYQKIDLESENMKMLLALCKKWNLPMIFHTGYVKGGGRATAFNPMELASFMTLNPDNIFIIAHLGNPYFDQMIILLEIQNVYTDISGIMEDNDDFSVNDRDYFMKMYDRIPVKKFLYGTDYPVQTYEQTNELLDLISKKNKKIIMYNNAKEIFNVV